MSATHFSGPVMAGTLINGQTNGPNQGFVRLKQVTNLTANGTNAVSSTIYVPAGSRLSSFEIDVLTAFNSASSATLTIGTTAGATTYVGSIDAKTTGRATVTFTAAQLAAMAGQTVLGVASPVVPAIVITITPVGATGTGASNGYVTVAVNYMQQ